MISKRWMKCLCLITVLALLTGGMVGCGQRTVIGERLEGKPNDDLVDANIAFAFDIFRALNREDAGENVFISPYSISAALSMILNGADGHTARDMKHALMYHGLDIDQINHGHRHLIDRLTTLDEKVTVNIANSIWVRDQFPVKPSFISINSRAFDAQVENLDFDKPDAHTIINGWIDEATKGLIDKMIDPPIPADAIMYLINAIYFQGDWTVQFDKDDTRDDEFTTYEGETIQRPMMQRKGTVEYYDADAYKAIKLPYGDEKLGMYLMLPDEKTDIETFIQGFDQTEWFKVRNHVSEREDVFVQIPRFEMEYGIKNLNDVLSKLGMASAFVDSADFSNLSDIDTAISRVLHKAVITVDEQGTEAAAVTVGEIRVTSIMEPIEFIANRPFMFLIADEEEGTVLFMGKLLE